MNVTRNGEHWADLAWCRDMDTEEFYVGTTDDTGWYGARNVDHLRYLRTVCRQCPVAAACRDAAIAEFDRHAFRGGMTPPERRKYARKVVSA